MPAPRPTRPSRAAEPVSKSLGRGGKSARQEAEKNATRNEEQHADVSPPLAPDGHPLTMVEMSASELIPTGQYANISIGPARVRMWIDPREEEPISADELEGVAKALNKLGDLVQIDVIAVQRNLTLESMQSNISND